MNENSLQHITVLLCGVIAFIYLVNPAPDRAGLVANDIPYLGNLDEFLASVLLIGTLRYFHLDPVTLFWQRGDQNNVRKDIGKVEERMKEKLKSLEEKSNS